MEACNSPELPSSTGSWQRTTTGSRQSPGVKFAKMAKVDSCVCKVLPYPVGGQCLTTAAQRTRRDEMRRDEADG